MAFTVTTTDRVPGTGAKQHVYGIYVNDGGSTGGDITTYLNTVQQFFMQPWGSAVSANQPVVNETLPLTNTNGVVTVVTSANESGNWLAIGF